MIDSHTTFIERLGCMNLSNKLKYLKANGYKKPILSGYPQDSINMKNKELIQLM